MHKSYMFGTQNPDLTPVWLGLKPRTQMPNQLVLTISISTNLNTYFQMPLRNTFTFTTCCVQTLGKSQVAIPYYWQEIIIRSILLPGTTPCHTGCSFCRWITPSWFCNSGVMDECTTTKSHGNLMIQAFV